MFVIKRHCLYYPSYISLFVFLKDFWWSFARTCFTVVVLSVWSLWSNIGWKIPINVKHYWGSETIFGSFVLFVTGCFLKPFELKVSINSFPTKLNYTAKFQENWSTKTLYDEENKISDNTQATLLRLWAANHIKKSLRNSNRLKWYEITWPT